MRLLALRAETMQGVRRLKLPCDDITPIGLWGTDMFLIGVNNEQFEVLRAWNVQTEDVTPATLRDLHTDSPAVPTVPSAGNTASDARSSATAEQPYAASTDSHSSANGASSGWGASQPSPSPAPAPAVMPEPARMEQARMEQASPMASSAPASAPARMSSVDPSPLAVAPLVLDTPESLVSPMRAPEAPSVSGSSHMGGSATMPAFSAPQVPEKPALTLEPKSGSSSRSSRTEERKLEVARPIATESESRPDAKDNNSTAGKLRMTVDGEHLYAEIKGGKIQLKDRTYDSLAHARDSIRRERNKVAVWEYFDEGVKAWRVLNRD